VPLGEVHAYNRLLTTVMISGIYPDKTEVTLAMDRTLMIVSETMAVVAVAIQFVLPHEVELTLMTPHRAIALPIRWIVPLLMISLAGVLSLAAVFSMYWRLAHVPISGVGQ
jgi:hypothetical protein